MTSATAEKDALRRKILAVLRAARDPLRPGQVAARLGIETQDGRRVGNALYWLWMQGLIQCDGLKRPRRYWIAKELERETENPSGHAVRRHIDPIPGRRRW